MYDATEPLPVDSGLPVLRPPRLGARRAATGRRRRAGLRGRRAPGPRGATARSDQLPPVPGAGRRLRLAGAGSPNGERRSSEAAAGVAFLRGALAPRFTHWLTARG